MCEERQSWLDKVGHNADQTDTSQTGGVLVTMANGTETDEEAPDIMASSACGDRPGCDMD